MEKFIFILKCAFVALIQGVAEILPISSSGHMVIASSFLGMNDSDLTFEIFLHFASLIAIIFFFRKRLIELIRDFFIYIFKRKSLSEEEVEPVKHNFWYCILIVIATIPAGIAGIFLDDIIGEYFSKLWVVGVCLIITAVLLYLSTKVNRIRKTYELKWYQALVIGLFQVLGIFPGISRSGSCLVGASVEKVEQSEAAEFAFILAIPMMLGSAIVKVSDIKTALANKDLLIPYLIAFLITLFVTYFSLKVFLVIVRKQKLSWFSLYCLAMGTIAIILNFVL